MVKTTNQRETSIPGVPESIPPSPKNPTLDYVQIHGRRWGRMILVKRDEWHNERRAGPGARGPGPSPLWPAVNIFLSSPGAGLKRNFVFRDMCFLLSDRTPRSLRQISSTMSPSRAGCRTEWAAGWPGPTSCTAEPAGSTSRSWPTRGSTQTATMEPCMVGTAVESTFKMFN